MTSFSAQELKDEIEYFSVEKSDELGFFIKSFKLGVISGIKPEYTIMINFERVEGDTD